MPPLTQEDPRDTTIIHTSQCTRSRLLTSISVTNTITRILANSSHLSQADSGTAAKKVVIQVHARNRNNRMLTAEIGILFLSLPTIRLTRVTIAINGTHGKVIANP